MEVQSESSFLYKAPVARLNANAPADLFETT
jgi:hypothetical protein